MAADVPTGHRCVMVDAKNKNQQMNVATEHDTRNPRSTFYSLNLSLGQASPGHPWRLGAYSTLSASSPPQSSDQSLLLPRRMCYTACQALHDVRGKYGRIRVEFTSTCVIGAE